MLEHLLTPEERQALREMCTRLAVCGLLMSSPAAHADNWTGKDKAGHAQAGAAIGSIFTAATQSPTVGCVAAVVAGLGKEAWDTQHPGHDPSVKDAAVTALAGCLAAKVTGVVIGPRFIGWRQEF